MGTAELDVTVWTLEKPPVVVAIPVEERESRKIATKDRFFAWEGAGDLCERR